MVLLFIKGLATYGHTVILSKISNAILANNQRRLFAKLMSESIGFYSERHSSEFLARLTSGAKSITDVLTLLINAVGRDVLLLVSLIGVMVSQDPVLSFIGLVVVPPAMLILRKLVKRIKGLAHNQFTGSADIMETMQESLQGIRTVKAFTLEATMQRRIDENIAIVERNANKMARVSNRSNPLMEMLGGFAVAGCLLYGGYSVVALGATPGQFFSFMTAFLLATEPAKRLARLNIDLNSQLVGARMLLEVVDSPETGYARFETAGGVTFSVQIDPEEKIIATTAIYLECDDLDERVEKLARSGIAFEHGPRNQPWMWREARLRDPDGNIIFFYKAGENRRFPPWRIEK